MRTSADLDPLGLRLHDEPLVELLELVVLILCTSRQKSMSIRSSNAASSRAASWGYGERDAPKLVPERSWEKLGPCRSWDCRPTGTRPVP